MLKNLTMFIAPLVFSALAATLVGADPQGSGGGGDTPGGAGSRVDCILLLACEPDANCVRLSSGRCSIGGTHGDNGWWDWNGDLCGCQK